jgi:hypothetical protein
LQSEEMTDFNTQGLNLTLKGPLFLCKTIGSSCTFPQCQFSF